MGASTLTPVRRGGLTPPRTSASGGGGGSGSGLAHFDRALIALCLLASLALLYRCMAMPGDVPLGGGGSAAGAATVIATVRGGSSVKAQLVVGGGGRLAAAAAATSPRSRRATLRGAAAARQAQRGAGGEGSPAGGAAPELPPDFDAQVGAAALGRSSPPACSGCVPLASWAVSRSRCQLLRVKRLFFLLYFCRPT